MNGHAQRKVNAQLARIILAHNLEHRRGRRPPCVCDTCERGRRVFALIWAQEANRV